MNKKELWLRLCNYHFDNIVPPSLWDNVVSKFGGANASAKAFAHKLAAKRGWKDSFALKAVSEYKKFIYLGVVSDFVVTPSEIIDKAWHQHILFSKAYRNFCSDVIEYEFDHTPELIPLLIQTGIYNAQYLDTLALYKKEFDMEPPADIWGTPKFDENAAPVNGRSKKKETVPSDGGSYSDSFPLYMNFDSGNSYSGFEGYGGGDFGGAGAGGDWSDSSSSDSGSDGGSSCSSCSSGCGGGD
jgi:hypothetical protein